jgi:serine/threonine protein kinase
VPRTFGRYRLCGYLGRGGFADVYVAHDEQLERSVAVKVLRLDRESTAGSVIDQVMLEARFYSRLNHPRIVSVHDVGEQDGYGYIVTDLVEGPSLRDWLVKNRPTWQQAVQIAADVADALHYVHERGIVHRDVKPANILLTKDLRGVLADMGLAVSASGTDLHPGRVVGTHGYVSPEQARGEAVDGRTDIYSLGAVLYEMLTGQPPFGAGRITELLQPTLERELIPPSRLAAGVPRRVERICLTALAGRCDERYRTAGDMARRLDLALAAGWPFSLSSWLLRWLEARG